jgi:regulator of Ty1 transposition protein 103
MITCVFIPRFPTDNFLFHLIFFPSTLQIDIWEDRKIFDTQTQSLKDDFFRRLKEIRNKLVSELIYFDFMTLWPPLSKQSWFPYRQKNTGSELLEKVVSSYKHVLNTPMDEDTLMRKCQAALINFDELNKTYGNNSVLGKLYVFIGYSHMPCCYLLVNSS